MITRIYQFNGQQHNETSLYVHCMWAMVFEKKRNKKQTFWLSFCIMKHFLS